MFHSLYKKIIIISLFFTNVFSLFKTNSFNKYNENVYLNNTIINNINVDELDIRKETNNYNYKLTNNTFTINATKEYYSSSLSSIEELSFTASDKVNVKYSIEYDMNNYVIYLNNSFVDNKGNIIYQNKLDGYPIYYENKETDVLFKDNEKSIYLSSLSSDKESCFFLSAFFISALSMMLIKTALAVCTVVLATVVVLGVAYQLVKATDDILSKARAKAEEERRKNENKVYFLAKTCGRDLAIAESPIELNDAVYQMRTYLNSFWTPLEISASIICYIAGGNMSPIKDKLHFSGCFYHYHPYGHNPDVHCWYGGPVYY